MAFTETEIQSDIVGVRVRWMYRQLLQEPVPERLWECIRQAFQRGEGCKRRTPLSDAVHQQEDDQDPTTVRAYTPARAIAPGAAASPKLVARRCS